MDPFLRDLRYAVRTLGTRPGYAAVAVLTLALGIGANSAIFSVADALLFRPLLVADPDSLVSVFGTVPGRSMVTDQISPADFLDWREQVRTLEHLSATSWWETNITGGGDPESVRGFRVSSSFFRTVGEAAFLGRTFLPEEEHAGRGRVAVLSHGLWKRRFGADPAIVSKTLGLNGETYEIIGVMPESFRYPPPAELWVPLALDERERGARGSFYLDTVARLGRGRSLAEANAELATLGRRLAERYPETHSSRGACAKLVRERVSGELTRDYTWMLLGTVGFVLLIACANVANLELARATARRRETAVRSALGAGRWRLARMQLVESALLGLTGAALGLVLARWGVALIRAGMPPEVEIFLPGWRRMEINSAVLVYTLAIAVCAGILAGLAPALASARADLNEGLKEGGRGSTGGRHRFKNMLVVAEISLALVLLVGAGLIIKGFRAVGDPAPNLEPERVLTMRLALPETRYRERDAQRLFQERLLDRVREIPGAASVVLITNVPYTGGRSSGVFTIEGRPAPRPGEAASAQWQSSSAGYFRTMHLPMRRGRDFTAADGPDSPKVAIVSEALARRYFPGEDPLGRAVKLGPFDSTSPWLTIVGVAADVLHDWTDRVPRPALYRPQRQAPPRSFTLAVRTERDPAAFAAPLRAAVLAVDPDQPVFEVRTWRKAISDQLVGLRYVAVLMGIFGLLALVLAIVGIYAVMSYSVGERTHEIGVRMALGARAGDVLRLVLRRGLVLTSIGAALGLLGSAALARLLESILFGVEATDPTAFIAVTLLLAGTALLASYVPARRAARLDPMVSLRCE